MIEAQPDLLSWTPPKAYRGEPPSVSHSETSKAAAEAIKPTTGKLHQRIMEYLERVGNATDEEMQIALEMNPNTQRPRRRELELDGKIKDSGKTRKVKSGQQAVVWIVA